jgi:hypothetical protein
MSHDELIEQYLAGPGLLRRAVAGMTRDQLPARPIPGKWSTQEVVCHLADYEPIYADRMKRVIALKEARAAGVVVQHVRDVHEGHQQTHWRFPNQYASGHSGSAGV